MLLSLLAYLKVNNYHSIALNSKRTALTAILCSFDALL